MNASAALPIEAVRAHLANMVGEEHVDSRTEALVVSPADAPQVAQILRFANDNGLVVTPVGSRTKSRWGNPVKAQIQLSTSRMHSVREHSWQDMTCTVEAGCTWAALETELARHGQMVALDPLWPDRATIGGIVAVNDGGAMRLKYGGLRDLIIGMTLVLADGTIAKTGGNVVKNVAGYDLHKLMTGSFGTLGVITEVNFRLHPIEEHVRTWTAAAKNAQAFTAPLRALLDSRMIPSSVQLRAGEQGCEVDIRIAAVPECLDQNALDLAKLFSGISPRESGKNVWQARQELFDSDYAVILKTSVLPSEIFAVIAELERHSATNGAAIRVVAQANGLLTIAFSAATEAVIASIESLRDKVSACRDSLTILQLPDEWRSRIDVWGCNSSALALMREIKRRFDPNRILNPSRFVGNI